MKLEVVVFPLMKLTSQVILEQSTKLTARHKTSL